MDHVSQRKKKPFHDSHVLKKQFHGKLDNRFNNRFIRVCLMHGTVSTLISDLTSLPVS
jgi:hypothetical protein